MSDELICARCHLPVDLRDALHMGKHVVHDASICVTLLQSRLEQCETVLRDLVDWEAKPSPQTGDPKAAAVGELGRIVNRAREALE